MNENVTCGFCHAAIPRAEYTAHDIEVHNGLARMTATHKGFCDGKPVSNCFCALEEYEKVAAEKS